jgi:predicted metal-binding transcription factor (methanogenesis marker protein 9)
MIKALKKIPKELLRDIPGWKHAPVPICMGGDFRALTWCCKPGYALTFGYKCRRDQKLKEVGMSPEEFIRIKEEFSQKHNWGSEFTCYGSLSYCCMRQSGCYRRDQDLAKRYPNMSYEEILKEYYSLKKLLAQLLLKNVKNHELVQDYIDHED